MSDELGLRNTDGDDDIVNDDVDHEKSGDENADGDDNDDLQDSSEEESDDDEEEAARIREGFIVDDDDEEEDIAKPRRKKRRRKTPDEMEENDETKETDDTHGIKETYDENELDEDDLDLLLENTGKQRREQEKRFKRLKRGKADDDGERGLTDIFSDEEQHEDENVIRDEFDDFIEEDEFSDDERLRREEEEIRTRPSKVRGTNIFEHLSGFDREKLSEIEEVFGQGDEYDWALEGEEEEDVDEEEGPPQLKDVFEPGELKARLLTDEDNAIRAKDEPERYQILRSNLRMDYELNDADFQQEQDWIADKLEIERKAFLSTRSDLVSAFKSSVKKVVEFIVRENLEPPFIWQHRRDYIVHIKSKVTQSEEAEPSDDNYTVETLLTNDDLWRIVQLDMEFHGLHEKRKSANSLYENLVIYDFQFEDALKKSESLVDYQDLMDYLQFQYSAEIRNLAQKDTAVEDELQEQNGTQKKKHSRFGVFERIRTGKIYDLVKDFGLTAEQVGENTEADHRLNFAEDKPQPPLVLAENYVRKDDDNEEDKSAAYSSPEQALTAAEQMFTEELFYNLKMRKTLRNYFWRDAKIDIVLTEKGQKKIDELSPYYDFKYAINRSFNELRLVPELYLRMLSAEAEGLVEVRVSYPNYKTALFEKMFTKFFASDNVSDVAMSWNESRRRIFKGASRKLVPLICRNIREDLRKDCVREMYFEIRKKFGEKVNQAPYKPPAYVAGTIPKVLALTAGMGDFNRDAIVAMVVDESGQPCEALKLQNPSSVEFKIAISDVVRRQAPDVIGIAGFTVNSTKLYEILQDIVQSEGLVPGGDAPDKKIEVIWVQDEVARLFQTSKKGLDEFPDKSSLGRYCIALGRYVQSPLLEYVSLGPEISAIHILPNQQLIPSDVFQEAVETVYVDYVNLTGVDINEAVRNSYVSQALSYISGLGPRKASGIVHSIQNTGIELSNRAELITKEITTRNIFFNCASFLKFPHDNASKRNEEVDVLDATRIHPEDYELARKMAADALELDEEDVESYESSGGVVGHLLSEGPEKLNELILSLYADELEKKFNQRKRMTLEMIKEELLNIYGEKRAQFAVLGDLAVFTMLTGETTESLKAGSVVSASLRKVTDRQMIARLSCGIDGLIDGSNITDRRDVRPSSLFTFGQAIRAVVLNVDYHRFSVELSTKEHVVKDAIERKRRFHDSKKWNFAAEDADKKKSDQRREAAKPTGRIIRHPLFRPLNSRQAEEELAVMQRGDLVIRPSSRGFDHIAITWKVADQIYQHLDVVEVPSRQPGQKVYAVNNMVYQDLDELIIMHIQAMARKVDEMVSSDKFQKGSRGDVEKWLTAYTDANPRRSIYAFCFDHKRAGYFLLCFKTSQKSPVQTWNVKVIPNGYELRGSVYADIASLSNGFKKLFMHAMQNQPVRHY